MFPDEITAIAFENNPPLDPPAIFIDLAPSMTPEQQLDFLCTKVLPKIRSLDDAISATVSYGWWTDECDEAD